MNVNNSPEIEAIIEQAIELSNNENINIVQLNICYYH